MAAANDRKSAVQFQCKALSFRVINSQNVVSDTGLETKISLCRGRRQAG